MYDFKFYTIPTLEIADRLRKVTHVCADAIVCDGNLFLVLIAEGEENTRYIIQQTEMGVHPTYCQVSQKTLSSIADLYTGREHI